MLRKRLSSGEWGVVSALSRTGKGASVDDVRSELATGVDRDYRTIQTILHRCCEKGWVKVQRQGRRCYYSEVIAHSKAVEERTTDFLAELAEGEPAVLKAVQRVVARELRRLDRTPPDRPRR